MIDIAMFQISLSKLIVDNYDPILGWGIELVSQLVAKCPFQMCFI